MKKHKLKLLCAIAAAAFLLLVLRPKETSAAISGALHLCCNTLIPALLPYLILSSFFVRSGCASALSRRLRFLEGLFCLGDNSAGAILLGSVCGYPAGAKTIGDLYGSGQISKHDAEQLLSFACNASPAFFFAVIGGTYYRPIVGVTLFIVHIAASFLCGLLTADRQTEPSTHIAKREPISATSALVESIAESGTTMLQICFFVTAFSIPQLLLQNMPSLASVLTGIIELSSGITALSAAAIPWKLKYALNAFYLGFGGLCITIQTAAILAKSNLRVRHYFIGKLRHGLLSAILAFPVSFFISPAAPTLAQNIIYKPISPWPWTLLPVGMIFLIFLQFPSRNSIRGAV